MRILVTGGTGFLGSKFVRAAASQGHQLGLLTRLPSAPIDSADLGIATLPGTVAEPDWESIKRFAPEACVHAAWIATPGVYLDSPENEAWVNWSTRLIVKLSEIGVRHVTVLGTCIEYRMTGQPLHEDSTPVAPVSRYARCKHQLHQELLERLDLKKMRLAWARIFYPYGEGEHPARLASSLISKIRAGQNILLKTPHSVKDYIHATDIAAALLTVVERDFCGAINLGSGEGVQVEFIARRIAELLGRPDLVQVPENPPSDPFDFVVADPAKLHALGWKQQVELEEGLHRLIDARTE